MVTVAQVQAYGFTQSVALIEEAINSASQAIENYCQTIIKAQTDIREWVNGEGGRGLYLRNIPATSVRHVGFGSRVALTVTHTASTDLRATVEVTDEEIKLKRITSAGVVGTLEPAYEDYATASLIATNITASVGGWTAAVVNDSLCADFYRMAGTDAQNTTVDILTVESSASIRHVDEACGVVYLRGGHHACGPYNYLVQYDAGYLTIPADIQKACLDIVSSMLNNAGRDEELESETLGDYSYTRASGSSVENGDAGYITGNAAALLAPYRRRGF